VFVAALRVHLHFPEAGSLKAKRSELNSVKAHLRQRHGASVAEVEHHERWQRSTLAVAVAERTEHAACQRADSVLRALDARFPQGVRVERRVTSWDDLEALR
jgi:uncharacterized protein YlxP (DUF503 family)